MAVRVQNHPATARFKTAMVGPNRAWVVESGVGLHGRFVTAGLGVALVTIADL